MPNRPAPLSKVTLSDLVTLDDLVIAASLGNGMRRYLSSALDVGDVNVITVKKRGAGHRTVHRPTSVLLTLLHRQLKEFFEHAVPDVGDHAHGFIRGRSTSSNAAPHLGTKAVLVMDIKDFFPSISRGTLEDALVGFGASAEVATGIAHACTYADSLPAGFSTSPLLANLTFMPVDVELADLAKRKDFNYTRYADDLTFSGDVDDSFKALAQGILEQHGYELHPKKWRFQRRGRSQVVTGLSVADAAQVRVPRKFKKSVRQELHYTKLNGLEAQAAYRDLDVSAFLNRLEGRIQYIRGVEPQMGATLAAQLSTILRSAATQDARERN